MKTSLERTVCAMSLALFCLALSTVSAQTRADTSDDTARAELRKVVTGCAEGLERFLPGDYYFCAAARDMGEGHDSLSRDRLRDAAHWASKPAQYVLGLMSFHGDEVPLDRPLGIAWLALAAERHDHRFEGAFAEAYASASPEERAQANIYWRKMREEYGDRVAGRRAKRRFEGAMHDVSAMAQHGGMVEITGMGPMDQFAFVRKMDDKSEEFFRGLDGTVTVGEGQMSLVPVGKLADRAGTGADK
ncbi:hypothetical protein ACVWWJ_001941 [Luteibacter sp. HA06]